MDVIEQANALSKRVIGAAIEVHRELGPGFLEKTYQRAMEVELELQGIGFEAQAPVKLVYKGHDLADGAMDLLVGGVLVVELKAVETLLPVHQARAIAYLKATRHPLALLINFHEAVVRDGIKRVVLSQ